MEGAAVAGSVALMSILFKGTWGQKRYKPWLARVYVAGTACDYRRPTSKSRPFRDDVPGVEGKLTFQVVQSPEAGQIDVTGDFYTRWILSHSTWYKNPRSRQCVDCADLLWLLRGDFPANKTIERMQLLRIQNTLVIVLL